MHSKLFIYHNALSSYYVVLLLLSELERQYKLLISKIIMMMNTHCKFATTFGDRHPHLRLRIYSKSSEAMSHSCLQNSILHFNQFLSCHMLFIRLKHHFRPYKFINFLFYFLLFFLLIYLVLTLHSYSL
jgi:hypothetical protein